MALRDMEMHIELISVKYDLYAIFFGGRFVNLIYV